MNSLSAISSAPVAPPKRIRSSTTTQNGPMDGLPPSPSESRRGVAGLHGVQFITWYTIEQRIQRVRCRDERLASTASL